ncbi:hypothetical protein L195_g006645, partial [Trifolium pratense]
MRIEERINIGDERRGSVGGAKRGRQTVLQTRYARDVQHAIARASQKYRPQNLGWPLRLVLNRLPPILTRRSAIDNRGYGFGYSVRNSQSI